MGQGERAAVPSRAGPEAAAVAAASVGAGGRPPLAVGPAGVGGLPREELTPAVQAVLNGLQEDIAALHERVRRQQSDIEVLRQRLRLAEACTVVDQQIAMRTRHGFLQELARMLAYARGHQREICLALIEVERLDPDADGGAPAMADGALHQVSAALSASTRESDLLGRLGEATFGAILMDTDPDRADLVGARICDAIARRVLGRPDRRCFLAAAFGVASLKEEGTLDESLDRATADMRARRRAEPGPA